MQVRAHAKINWALRVTGKRADGYHDIETLFQTVTLHDTLTIEPSSKLALECDDPSIPVDDSNGLVEATLDALETRARTARESERAPRAESPQPPLASGPESAPATDSAS